jgi:peptidoglycan/LPS O-acetylase OafA/YrhL
MLLIEVSNNRQNNLNLLRFLSATAVLFSHSFAISTGLPSAEPLRSQTGMTLGSIAVDVFFLVSGFLVTASIFKSQSAVDFIVARILRIFPGLLVMLTMTVFGFGLIFTRIPINDYLTSGMTYTYFIKCLTLIFGVEYQLPGVFEDNPFRMAVNGSLWTLPYEVTMYGILVVVWLIFRAIRPQNKNLLGFFCIVAMLISGSYIIFRSFYSAGIQEIRFAWLFYMFFVGVSAFVFRSYIKLSTKILCTLIFLLLAAIQIAKPAFLLIYMVSIWYIVFYLAYIPNGFIRRYNVIGDFSYGIYIYAFPIQQSVVALVPDISSLNLFVWSGIVTLGFAMLSWVAVEKQALSIKVRTIGLLMTRLGYKRRGAVWERTAGV